MNNPGLNLKIWRDLRKKWSVLHSNGDKVSVEFKLISDPTDQKNILAIDVVQIVNDETIVETVQKIERQAYATLGIEGLSMEELIQNYKKMVQTLHRQSGVRDAVLTITMSPTSPTSGELRSVLESKTETKSNLDVNYQYYYVLNALREKMIQQLGENWNKVTTVYRDGEMNFYFDYP